MKKIGYLIFALMFNLCRIFPVQRRKVVLYNGHHRELSGNLLAMKREIQSKSDDTKFFYYGKHPARQGGKLWKVGRGLTFFLVLPFQMATAGQIFLNDNLLALGHCRPSDKTQLIQLWHGAGAFKKFGLSTEKNRAVREQVKRANRRITHLFVTSKQVIPFYSEAFAIPYERIFATGIPITDVYFDSGEQERGADRFYKTYPELQGRKLLLITPTFRSTPQENRELEERLHLDQMGEALGEEWTILLRLHPKLAAVGWQGKGQVIDVTGYPQITDLFFVSDMLMTDYSSTVVEYVLLDKPMVFYAYDLEKYDRGFYRDYLESVPGAVARDEEELFALLKGRRQEEGRRESFRKMQYDFADDASGERIWRVLEAGRQ